MIPFTRQFGVNGKLRQPVLVFSHVTLPVAMSGLAIFLVVAIGKNMFFQNDGSVQWPMWLYNFCVITLGIYLLLPAHLTNPGKHNYNLLLLTFQKRHRFFQSINDPVYHPMHIDILDKMPKSINHRLPIDIASINYETKRLNYH